MRPMLTFRDKGTSDTQITVLSGDVLIAKIYKGTCQ
jgi:hypothetical protein